MNQDNIKELLDRYLNKETSIEENRLIEQWLIDNGNVDPEWQKLDRLHKDQWLSSIFSEIQGTINTNKAKVVVMKPRKYLWYKITGAAAVLIISLSLYLSWPLSGGIWTTDLVAVTGSDGQKKHITLTDGSKVWLNAGSQIKYPKNFKGNSRRVYLSGEAYFDVQHDDSKPFIIETGKILTTVLGTAFNIKEDRNAQTIQVTVTRGKVSVADDGKLLGILTPNKQLSVNLITRIPTEKVVDAKTTIKWQDADILFDDITFADAAIQLQQHFNVKIAFSNDQLKNCRFSGSALKGDDLNKILKAICAFNNATWQNKPDGSIVIYGSGCQ